MLASRPAPFETRLWLSVSEGYGTTRSMSARNFSRRVRLFFKANSALSWPTGQAIRWIIALCLVGLFASAHAGTRQIVGRIVRVADGDTITLQNQAIASARSALTASTHPKGGRRLGEHRSGTWSSCWSTVKPWPNAARLTATSARSAACWWTAPTPA